MPSLVSGAILFFATLQLFRGLGFGPAWQAVAVLALLGQDLINVHLAEARPYIPLAAASVAMLAYYTVQPRDRTTVVQVVGWIGAIWGALIHPYFALYWPAILVVGYIYQTCTLRVQPSWSGFMLHANVPMCLIGSAIYLIVASNTWLAGSAPKFTFDPFQWLVGSPFLVHVAAALFNPWSLLLVGLGALFVVRQPKEAGGLLAPAALLICSIALALLVSYISYRRDYWILPRQWIASATLAPIAVVWLLAEMSTIIGRRRHLAAGLLWLLALIAEGSAAKQVVVPGLVALWHSIWVGPDTLAQRDCTPPVHIQLDPDEEKANVQWVALAQLNIACGGAVWPIFGKFYDREVR